MATLGSIRPFIASQIFEHLACIGGRKHDEQCHMFLMAVSIRSLSFLGSPLVMDNTWCIPGSAPHGTGPSVVGLYLNLSPEAPY